MNGDRREQFFDELLPLGFSVGAIRTGRAMCQLDQRNDRDASFALRDFASDGGQHLAGVLALALGGDEHARVEDHSHAGGLSGSRWLSTAASTSLAKSGSMVAVGSSGKRASHAEMVRRTGSAG